jgi:hypothetical protein
VTDRPDSPESDETPEIAEVRRLLAEARHTEPMPDAVAARLDDVLTGLTADAGSSAPSLPERTRPRPREVVVPIAAHRRRRVAALLVAAAAIVVGGVTIAPHLGSGSSSQSTVSEDTAGSGTESDLGNTANGKSEHAPEPLAPSKQLKIVEGRVMVRPRHFSTDARQGRVLLVQGQVSRDHDPRWPGGPRARAPGAPACKPPPAVLVYRPAEGTTQVVDLYVCGNDRPVRSTTLPAP